MVNWRHLLFALALTAPWPLAALPAADSDIRIDEIYYHPPSECEEEEFVELVNRGVDAVDISGWHFLEGVSFTFPGGTVVPPGGRVVVARDPDRLQAAFGPIDPVFGPFEPWIDGDGRQSNLSNGGEDLVLATAAGVVVERVRYNDRLPWPTSCDGGGPSLERISPEIDGNSAGAWRAAGVAEPGWQPYRATGRIGGNLLRFRLDGAGEYLLDDVSLRLAAGGPELLGDGDFEGAGEWVADGDHATSDVTTEDAHSGTRSLKVSATAGGAAGAVSRTVTGLALDGPAYELSFWARRLTPQRRLLAGFTGGRATFDQSDDIGAVGAAGSSSYDSASDTYSLSGSGADIWGTSDEFHYLHAALDGDGSIEGEVEWDGRPSNGWAKCGFMMRESTSPSSTHAMVLLSRDNGVRLQFRPATGGGSSDLVGPSTPGPVGLRLTRSGDDFIASADTGGGFQEFARATIPMAASIRVGMMVTAHDDGRVASFHARGVSSSGDSLSVRTPAAGDLPSLAATPGRVNTWSRAHVPPYLRKPLHLPFAPTSLDRVVVSVKADSPDGLAAIDSVAVEVQVVEPGRYVRITDPEYAQGWVRVELNDAGLDGDAAARDLVWSARLPRVPHRTLVRYRFIATDSLGAQTRLPYAGDESPNFAYFVYDGIPDYVADRRSAHGAVPFVHAAEGLTALPVVWLITDPGDFAECWNVAIPFGSKLARKEFRWRGTLVLAGEVFDHVRYRLRGGVWRYRYPKRYLKFKALRGHLFRGVDNFFEPYPRRRKTLDFGSVVGNPAAGLGVRGEDGLLESLAFWLFRQAGVPSSLTSWVQMRVVDGVDEAGADQYSGDFYGIYLDVEQPDSTFLQNHGRFDEGNLYKIDSGALNGRWDKETNNCNPADDSDIRQFVDSYSSSPPESWWRANLDLDSYYSYRSAIEMARHYDLGAGKNYYYYHNQDTDVWDVIVWDVDLTFQTNFSSGGNEPFKSRVIGRFPDTFGRDYRNRLREMIDLLYTEERLFPLIEAWKALIFDVARADRDRWDDGTIPPYASLEQRARELEAFLSGRIAVIRQMASDTGVPAQPRITSPAPRSLVTPLDLNLQSSPFSDDPGARHVASRWIATRVTRFSEASSVERRELIAPGATWRYRKGTAEPPGAPLGWTLPGYDDSTWPSGPSGIGYGDGDDATLLDDMRNGYSTVYVRREFRVDDPTAFGSLELAIDHDDGFVAYLNGERVAAARAPGSDPVPFDAFATGNHEAGAPSILRLDAAALGALRAGQNVLALQGLNVTLGSSDFSLAPALTAVIGEPSQFEPRPLRELLGENELAPDWDSGITTGDLLSVSIPPDALVLAPGEILRLRVRHEDETGRWSRWSSPLEVVIGEAQGEGFFRRGDANADGGRDLSDSVAILLWLFAGGAEPTCLDAADVDDSAQVEISDAIALLGWLFSAGAPPASPLACGVDPTSDGLGCAGFAPCGG